MSYTINLTDGTVFSVVAPGTVDTGSSMVLVGKNYAGYGEFMNENFIHLLESGANFTAPTAPLVGQLWWDKTTNTMKVYTGQGSGADQFKTLSGAIVKATAPTGITTGDFWWDSVAGQLKIWNGTDYTVVGPATTNQQGISGPVVETITDTTNNPRVVIKLYAEDELVAIISRGPAFTPQVPIPGFTGLINPGMQLSTAIAGVQFTGIASNAAALGGIEASKYLRNDRSGTIAGNLTLEGAEFIVGDAFKVSTSGTNVTVNATQNNGNISFAVNSSGTPTTALTLQGSTAATGVRGIVNLNANGVGDIGSSTNSFNTVYARATSAQYADLAERYAADAAYAPGTVVEIGGTHEVTQVLADASENVFGVVSTDPAYLMNSAAGDNITHPPIALTGRVPVRVVGKVTKGQRLVSAGNGAARAAKPGEATPYNVIGRALVDKTEELEQTILAVVAVKL